ncbi:MAG: arylsulfatase [Actinomycetota bacterium]
MVRPNIIILYADDLGFGDVGCYGGSGISTPNVDRLAAEGVRFTSGYAASATCTPSRYSLLTGAYPFRNPRAAILPADAPLIIPPGSPTLPAMLRSAGYKTSVVGKWHLGLGDGKIDWNADLALAPIDVGFDESYILPGTNDRVPCVYVDGRRVDGLDPADPLEVTYQEDQAFTDEPTGRDDPHLLTMRYSHGHDGTIVNGVSRIGWMRGGHSARWSDVDMADVLLARATSFIHRNRDRPFFLLYAFHQPHVPRLPHPRFAGTTGLGSRGDVIAEMDWCVGQITDTLDRAGLAGTSIVVFSSDNGPVLDDGYVDMAAELSGDHRPAGPLRGGKYSRLEGGARVPFILRWPDRVAPGESEAIVAQQDFFASFAALVGQPLSEQAAPDSENVLDALLGSGDGREELVTESLDGRTVLRQGEWAYLPAVDGRRYSSTTGVDLGHSRWPQLFNLGDDVGQLVDRAHEQPRRVAAMQRRLDEIHAGQRTRRAIGDASESAGL